MTSTEKFESFNWIRGVLDDLRITHMHRLILIRLIAHRGKDGRCDPGYALVAAELAVHRATVIRAVEVGVELEWLAAPARHGRVNLNFVFTFPDVQSRSSATSETASEVAAVRHQKKSEVAPVHVRSRTSAHLKSQCQRGLPVGSEASTRNGHLTGKENGQQQDAHAREELADKEVKATKEGQGQTTRAHLDHLERVCREAAGLENDPSEGLFNLAPIRALLGTGHDLDTDVLPTMRAIARAGRKGRVWAYYAKAIEETKAARERRGNNGAGHNTETKPTSAETDESRWRRMFDFWKRTELWPGAWGPPPGLWRCGGTDELAPIPMPLLLGWLLEAARLSPDYVPAHIARAIQSIEERWLPPEDYAAAAPAAEANAP